jgi:hypothetical protein
MSTYNSAHTIHPSLANFTSDERLKLLLSLNVDELVAAARLFAKETPPRERSALRITPEELEEFKAIYQDEYGISLSDLDATQSATNILNGVKLVLTGSTATQQSPISGIDNMNRKYNK